MAPVLDDIWNMLVGLPRLAGFSSALSATLPGLKDLKPGALSAGFSSFLAAPIGLKGPEAAGTEGFSAAEEAAVPAGLKDLEPIAGLDDAPVVFFSLIGLNGLGVEAENADGFSEVSETVEAAGAAWAAGLKDLEPTAGLDDAAVVFFSLIGLNGLGLEAANADGFSEVSETVEAAGAAWAAGLKDLEPTVVLGESSPVFFVLNGLNGLGVEDIAGDGFSEAVRPAEKRGAGFSDARGEAGP